MHHRYATPYDKESIPMEFKLSDLKYERDAQELLENARTDVKRIAEEHNARGVLQSGIFITALLKKCLEVMLILLDKRVNYDLENLMSEKQLIRNWEANLYKRSSLLLFDLNRNFAWPIISDWARRIGSSEMLDYLSKTLQTEIEKMQAKAITNIQIAKLEEEAKAKTETNSLIEVDDYLFIKTAKLRSIVERDIKELNNAILNSSYKSIIILSGSIVDAILLDALLERKDEALKYTLNKEKDLTKWNLEEIIEVSYRMNIIDVAVTSYSHTLRRYRNLIHSGKEIRDDLKVAPEEANIAIQVVLIVLRSLKGKGVA